MPGISKSYGVVPDMRYFLPIYLLGGLVGFYPLARWGKNILNLIASKKFIFLIPVISIFLTFFIVIMMPKASYQTYTTVYMPLTYVMGIIFVLLFLFREKFSIPPLWIGIILIVLISIPLSWQFLMDLFYSAGKVFGYPSWIPYLEYLTEKYLHYTIIN
jgi:FtsH-binding integral membrane protein